MPHIEFDSIAKRFGDSTVISDFNASIDDGEYLVLLGPSGCGKSTLLRMIAGLTDISEGTLKFDGEMANNWTPRKRGVAFVFQSYALYPHMTVRANIAFPLIMDAFRKWYHLPIVNSVMRRRLMNSPEIAGPVKKIASQLELEPLLNRRPGSLSGGQRQRVALARALVRDPDIYLLDEPLSNLDAKLRTQMRSEITDLHYKVGKTFIYVTHDQVEAMTMATRIIVMNEGEIQQIDTPDGIYDNPANTFVARFVGAPPMNLINVTLGSGRITSEAGQSWLHDDVLLKVPKAILGIRPEKMVLKPSGEGPISAKVAVIERLGAETVIGCRLDGREENAEEQRLIDDDLVFVRQVGRPRLKHGDPCSLDYDPGDVTWFDHLSGHRIAASRNVLAQSA